MRRVKQIKNKNKNKNCSVSRKMPKSWLMSQENQLLLADALKCDPCLQHHSLSKFQGSGQYGQQQFRSVVVLRTWSVMKCFKINKIPVRHIISYYLQNKPGFLSLRLCLSCFSQIGGGTLANCKSYALSIWL